MPLNKKFSIEQPVTWRGMLLMLTDSQGTDTQTNNHNKYTVSAEIEPFWDKARFPSLVNKWFGNRVAFAKSLLKKV